nr:CD4-1 [Lateolabrax maculatus]
MKTLIQSFLIVNAVLMSTMGAEEVVYAQVGDTVTLKPPVGTNLQRQYLYWFFSDLQVAWRNSFGGKGFHKDEPWTNRLSWLDDSLVIKNIQQEHFGTFSCKLKSKTLITFKVLKLNVTKSPSSLLLPGEILSLDCSVEAPQGHRKPEIYWLDPQGKKIANNEGPFKVTAKGQHNGQWTCVVRNDRTEHKATVSVTVVDLSPAPQRPQYTSLSSPLILPCSIPAPISWEQMKAKGIRGVDWLFFPKPSSNLISDDPQSLFSLSLEDPLNWKPNQDRGLTPVRDFKKGDLSLTRNRGREDDRGDYVCILKVNENMSLNRTVQVNVLKIISYPGTDLISGQQVNLTCSFGQPLPSDLRLKWFTPEQSSLQPLSPDHHRAHLTIPQVGTGDGGKWRCELWQSNTLLASTVITLKIEVPKLSVWMLVIICSATIIIILLLILCFIFYKRRQRKLRHLRHRLCQCKNRKPKGFYRT